MSDQEFARTVLELKCFSEEHRPLPRSVNRAWLRTINELAQLVDDILPRIRARANRVTCIVYGMRENQATEEVLQRFEKLHQDNIAVGYALVDNFAWSRDETADVWEFSPPFFGPDSRAHVPCIPAICITDAQARTPSGEVRWAVGYDECLSFIKYLEESFDSAPGSGGVEWKAAAVQHQAESP